MSFFPISYTFRQKTSYIGSIIIQLFIVSQTCFSAIIYVYKLYYLLWLKKPIYANLMMYMIDTKIIMNKDILFRKNMNINGFFPLVAFSQWLFQRCLFKEWQLSYLANYSMIFTANLTSQVIATKKLKTQLKNLNTFRNFKSNKLRATFVNCKYIMLKIQWIYIKKYE